MSMTLLAGTLLELLIFVATLASLSELTARLEALGEGGFIIPLFALLHRLVKILEWTEAGIPPTAV